jgi:WD40 repeat protein
VAAGGWTKAGTDSHNIYLFDRATGELTGRFTGLPNVICYLAYSRDGRYLAAALGEGGIRVYRSDRSQSTPAGEDTAYGSDSYCADFAPDGGLVTTCLDGFIRLYAPLSDSGLKLLKKAQAPGGKEPSSAVFSPDGSMIAVGFSDSTKVDVLSAKDLSHLYSPSTAGVDNGTLSKVSWSSDGERLFAGGSYNKSGQYPILAWPQAGQGSVQELSGADHIIMHILPLSSGKIVFGAGDPAFGVIAASGKRTLFQPPAIADHRGTLEGFHLSRDGKAVRFGYEIRGKSPAVFDLETRNFISGNATPRLFSPDTQNLNITDWKSTVTPKLNGTPLKLDQYEKSRSLAVSPSKDGFLLGTEWHLRFFDASGSERWNTLGQGIAWDVNIAKNGKTAAAAFSDGTIRWYRLSDGKELLAFFPHKDRKRWVLWTPSGYYDASAGADELIGWHVNNGKDRAADFFPVSKFKTQYYRPDAIAKILDTQDETEAIRLADQESGKQQQVQIPVSKMLPPVVVIHSPIDGDEIGSAALSVTYSVRSDSGEPVTAVRALVNGRPEEGSKRGRPVRPESDKLTIIVPQQDCEVSVIAENRFAPSEPATVRLKWKGKQSVVSKPKLYVLAVGVSNYQENSRALRFAAKDARDFAQAMQKQKGGLYHDVEIKVLADQDATKNNILDGLDWIQKKTTSEDVAAVFIAGHGMNDKNGTYYYLPVDYETDKEKRTGLVGTDIMNTVSGIAGKVVMFMDTCHSGNVTGGRKGGVDMNAFVNALTSFENGAVVFSSSTGEQASQENPEWNNGAFTKALVEGIEGEAGKSSGKDKITITMLDGYISDRVKYITSGGQTPVTTKRNMADFTIAVKR